MPKGQSYKTEPWSSFDKGDQTFIQDDFAHQKTFVFKAKIQKKDFGINLKEAFSEKGQGLTGNGQTKLWFDIGSGRSIYTKMTTNSSVSLHYDHGFNAFEKFKANFYGAVKSNRAVKDQWVKLGFNLCGNNDWKLGIRLKYDYENKELFYDDRFSWALDKKWVVNIFGTANITKYSSLALVRAGVLVGKVKTETCPHSFHLRLGNPKIFKAANVKEVFQNLSLNWNKTLNKNTKIGLEANATLSNLCKFSSDSMKGSSFWAGLEWKIPEEDITVKAKVSNQLTHAVTVKNKLGEYGYYSIGAQMSEIGSKNKFKYGVQLDLNL